MDFFGSIGVFPYLCCLNQPHRAAQVVLGLVKGHDATAKALLEAHRVFMALEAEHGRGAADGDIGFDEKGGRAHVDHAAMQKIRGQRGHSLGPRVEQEQAAMGTAGAHLRSVRALQHERGARSHAHGAERAMCFACFGRLSQRLRAPAHPSHQPLLGQPRQIAMNGHARNAKILAQVCGLNPSFFLNSLQNVLTTLSGLHGDDVQ